MLTSGEILNFFRKNKLTLKKSFLLRKLDFLDLMPVMNKMKTVTLISLSYLNLIHPIYIL